MPDAKLPRNAPPLNTGIPYLDSANNIARSGLERSKRWELRILATFSKKDRVRVNHLNQKRRRRRNHRRKSLLKAKLVARCTGAKIWPSLNLSKWLSTKEADWHRWVKSGTSHRSRKVGQFIKETSGWLHIPMVRGTGSKSEVVLGSIQISQVLLIGRPTRNIQHGVIPPTQRKARRLSAIPSPRRPSRPSSWENTAKLLGPAEELITEKRLALP